MTDRCAHPGCTRTPPYTDWTVCEDHLRETGMGTPRAQTGPLTLARALNRERDPDARLTLERELCAAIKGPRIARPWRLPDGTYVSVLREALEAWRQRATKGGRPRLHPPREVSGRGRGRPPKAPEERTTGETISPRVSPEAAAIYRSWPAGERGARLSALIEASADRR